MQYQAVTTTLTEDQSYWDLVSVFDLLLDGEPSEPGDLVTAEHIRSSDHTAVGPQSPGKEATTACPKLAI